MFKYLLSSFNEFWMLFWSLTLIYKLLGLEIFIFVSFIIFVRNKVLHIVNAHKIFVIDLSIN